jgi:hypothetical protein
LRLASHIPADLSPRPAIFSYERDHTRFRRLRKE